MNNTTTLSDKMFARMQPIVADLENGKDLREVTLVHEMSLSRLRSNLKEMGKEELIGVRKNARKPNKLTNDQLNTLSEKYFTGTPLTELMLFFDMPEKVIRTQLAANLPDVWTGV